MEAGIFAGRGELSPPAPGATGGWRRKGSAGIELLLQVLHLGLEGVDVAHHLGAEGVELGGIAALGRAVVELAAQYQQVILDTLDRLARVALLLQRRDIAAEGLELLVGLAQFDLQGFQLLLFGGQCLQLAVQ